MLGGLHPVTPLRRTEVLVNCVTFPLFYHRLCLSLLSPSLPLCPPMELLDKFPDQWCWQALPTPAQAGSPWKSIAGYCWNNNHSNRSCKYLWDGNAGPLCQPKLISRRRSCSWCVIPPCFTLTAILSFIWNFMPFSTPQPSVRASRCAV